MLVDFSVENYRSIKDRVTLSLIAADKLKARERRLDEENRCQISDDLSLLRSAVIYGANASGKSNVLKAFHFMQKFVSESSRESQFDDPIPVEHFRLGGPTADTPSEFEVVFLVNGTQYRYGFAVTRARIREEWLYYVPSSRETALFTRSDDTITMTDHFKEGEGLAPRTRANALFLSVAAQFNGEIARTILQWFSETAVLSEENTGGFGWGDLLSSDDPDRLQRVVEFVKRLDVGIDDIHVGYETIGEVLHFGSSERVPLRSVPRIWSIHRTVRPDGTAGDAEEFDFIRSESAGTWKLLRYADALLEALRHGRAIWVDELDARLHPLITLAILRLFNSNETNPHGAQLIFTTHDTNLLNNRTFRRDQVWFTQKDRYGATQLYSLADYRVRNDASFESDYIKGKYGAVPFVGDFTALLDDASDDRSPTDA